MNMEKELRVIIDRFEGGFAVCETEDREIINIEKSKLPEHAKEGDVLVILNGSIGLDLSETEKRKREIEELTDGLWK